MSSWTHAVFASRQLHLISRRIQLAQIFGAMRLTRQNFKVNSSIYVCFTTTTLALFTEDKWHSSKKYEVSDYYYSFEQNNFYGDICKMVSFLFTINSAKTLIDSLDWRKQMRIGYQSATLNKKKNTQIHGNMGKL